MKKRKKKPNRTGLYLVMTVVLLFCATLGIHSISLRATCSSLQEQKTELEAKKSDLKKKQKASKNRRSTCRQMNTLKKWPEKSLVWSMMMKSYSKQSRIVSKSFFDTVLFLTTFEPLIRYT